MSKLKDLITGESNYVSLREIHDGDAIYEVRRSSTDILLQFRIPKEDLLGAVFKLEDSPKYFMRWIRKELLRQEAEEQMIEQARLDWEKENSQ